MAIKTISTQDVEEIYNILAVLESYATSIATKNLITEDKEQLRALHDDTKKAWDVREYRESLKKNRTFHDSFVKASGNRNLVSIISNLRNRLYRYGFITLTLPGHFEESHEAHGKIVSAIFKNDGEQAAKVMRDHLLQAARTLVDFLKQSPGL